MAAADNNVVSTAPNGGDGFVGGPRSPQQKRQQQTQDNLDEIVDIMKTNVETVLEHGHKLSDLDARVHGLHHYAAEFEEQTAKFKQDPHKSKTKKAND